MYACAIYRHLFFFLKFVSLNDGFIISLLWSFNKREEDFPSLKEYNDYLEEVEDMSKSVEFLDIWEFLSTSSCHSKFENKIDRIAFVKAANLIEGIDVPTIEAKIARYQEENAEQIMINRARKVHQKNLCLPLKNLQIFFSSQSRAIKFVIQWPFISISEFHRNNKILFLLPFSWLLALFVHTDCVLSCASLMSI